MSPRSQPEREPSTAEESLASPLGATDLADVMQAIMRIGILMLRSGTVSFRVEQAMHRSAKALGADRLDAFVTLTGIMASVHCNNQHYTQIARVKNVGADMNRLSAVERLSQTIPPHTTADTVCQILDQIEAAPLLYPNPLRIVLVAVACGCFAVLNQGDAIEWLAAAGGAGVGQTVRSYLQQSHLNLIAVTIPCAAIATVVCHLIMQGVALIGWTPENTQAGFLATVLFLVPGMPLVTAALDLVRFDLSSGMARIAHALIVMFSVAIGILLVVPLIGLSIL
ncbi:threonine/serine exporter family protein [Thermocoleostomius sinensis]|uniref:Threonine/serine exporter family protein n=1 Tax=Thermocoleostomius sinensis A174 TaxID=2016057 RepID=A0A9E8Z9K1_9CYAN|nr:threonine/serine exporter family protein [Thermocoleostomius sinensis]WAL58792.1 threonine/serine exporter family protein [Thermocoleostomius sinensis A174]